MNGGCFFIYDRQGRSKNSCVSANARRWSVLSRSSPGFFINMPDLECLFVRHATEIKYLRRKHDVLRSNISSKSDMVHFSFCCLSRLLSFFYLIREVDTLVLDMT